MILPLSVMPLVTPASDVHAGDVADVADLDRALVVELMVAVDDHAAAGVAVHHAGGIDEDIVGKAA